MWRAPPVLRWRLAWCQRATVTIRSVPDAPRFSRHVLRGCSAWQVLEDTESLLNYGIHRHSVIHHKAVRQRTYSDVDYSELSKFTEDMQRKKRYAWPSTSTPLCPGRVAGWLWSLR